MKKSLFVSVLALVLALLMLIPAGCSGKEDKPKEKMTAEEVYNDVYEVSGFGTMTAVPKRDYIEIYGIDTNNFADSAWFVSDNPSLNADEAAIFLVKPEKDHYPSVLVTLLQKHLDTRIKVAESYSPEESAKLKKAEIKTVECDDGVWVYFCVGSEYDKMMEVFKKDIG